MGVNNNCSANLLGQKNRSAGFEIVLWDVNQPTKRLNSVVPEKMNITQS